MLDTIVTHIFYMLLGAFVTSLLVTWFIIKGLPEVDEEE